MRSLILSATSRVMLPLLLFFSVFLLVRGHDYPGGGFAGALVAASAYVLFAIANGTAASARALRVEPLRLAGVGLCVAAVSGLVPLAGGLPWFTGLWAEPGFAQSSLAAGTPLLFDAGVFLTVLGAVLAVLLSLVED